MGQTCILTGMILKVAPAGEYDKRITILTRERGKVTAFARGARRAKSAMQAGTELFCFGRFEAYEGRDAYTVVKAEIQNYFRDLYTDLEKTCYGCYFLEVADYFTQPGDDGTEQLKLLYQTLRALSVKSLDVRLVRTIYELKTLVIYGVSPRVFSCVSCGKQEGLSLFSVEKRGVLCSDCCGKTAGYPAGVTDVRHAGAVNRSGMVESQPDETGVYPNGVVQRPKIVGYPLDAAALYTLQYIVASPVEKLYTFKVTESVYETVSAIVERYLKLYVDREFHSLELLG